MRNPFHLLPKAVDIGKFLKQDQTAEAHKVHALAALQRKGHPMYQGSVDKAVVQRRRARNKVARRSRRINRLRGQ